jgi:type VI secretion system protein ImpF
MNGRKLSRNTGSETLRAQMPLLDRLIDDAPDNLREAPLSAVDAEMALKQSVHRDLEALLNTRRRWRSWSPEFGELKTSLLAYGITDFASGAFNDPEQRDRLRGDVELAIRRFEPRLTEVRVTLVESPDTLDATLRLRIDAVLLTEPSPEPVAFDTLVDSATAEVQIKPNADSSISMPTDV